MELGRGTSALHRPKRASAARRKKALCARQCAAPKRVAAQCAVAKRGLAESGLAAPSVLAAEKNKTRAATRGPHRLKRGAEASAERQARTMALIH